MKTAISISDDLFDSADALAARMDVSRSQLYSMAVAEFVAKHRDTDVTARLNDVYAQEPSGIEEPLRTAQGRSSEVRSMVIQRREIWWADLEEARGSGPGFRRPVLVVQADSFNRSRLPTILAVVLTSNMRLLEAPGNVLLPSRESGLPKDSTAVVSQVVTLDQEYLESRAGQIPPHRMAQVDAGLRLALDL